MSIFWECFILTFWVKTKCFRLKVDVEMAGVEENFMMGSRSEGEFRPGDRGRTMIRLEQVETTNIWVTKPGSLFILTFLYPY